MNLTLIPTLEEKLARVLTEDSASAKAFYAHLRWPSDLSGKRTLEIGGTLNTNLAKFFRNRNAHYKNVNAYPRAYVLPRGTICGKFERLGKMKPFDIVISSGVFEKHGIVRGVRGNGEYDEVLSSDRDFLTKLYELTGKNGLCIIGTISGPCFFTNRDISRIGFDLQSRTKSFYDLDRLKPDACSEYSFEDSELLVMQKPVKGK